MNPGERGNRLLIAAAIVAFLLGFALLSRPSGVPFMPICLFKGMTGLPCPLCGGTRAAYALMHGDVGTTVYLNPLAIPAVGLCVFAVMVMIYEATLGEPLANWHAVGRRLARLAPFLLILLGIWWIPHIYLALRVPKMELIELRNPIARAAYTHLPGASHQAN